MGLLSGSGCFGEHLRGLAEDPSKDVIRAFGIRALGDFSGRLVYLNWFSRC